MKEGSVPLNYRDTLLRMFDVTNRKIDNLDTISVRIKTWCITLWGILIAQYIAKGDKTFMVLAVLEIAAMWLIDIHYKFFHEQFLVLSWRMEALILKEEVTANEIAAVNFKNNITGRVFTNSGLHPSLKACFKKYWFHLAYLLLLLVTSVLFVRELVKTT